MTSYFDPNQGFFAHSPSWHRLEHAVLGDWPGTWAEARVEAKLDWEPVTKPVFDFNMAASNEVGEPLYDEVPGYQIIKRTDTKAVLSVQPSTYRVINNTEFGAVIESVLGMDWDEHLKYEGVFTLHGGKQVVAVCFFEEPLAIPGDPSTTVRYAVFVSRHDGLGGLRCILTNVRVVCANTLSAAEMGAKEEFSGFTIRHTANWDERVAEIREKMLAARQGTLAYQNLMERLVLHKVTSRQRERYLEKFLPTGTDMAPRQLQNRLNERQQVRTILEGPTCEHIGSTAYGLLQASTEWSDHVRDHRTPDSYVTRQLLSKQPMKERALALTRVMVRA